MVRVLDKVGSVAVHGWYTANACRRHAGSVLVLVESTPAAAGTVIVVCVFIPAAPLRTIVIVLAVVIVVVVVTAALLLFLLADRLGAHQRHDECGNHAKRDRGQVEQK